jgi:hypothetical protein
MTITTLTAMATADVTSAITINATAAVTATVVLS